ncbi:autoinducer binding domain-containing protein [Cupriavidus nantongensis]|uniref:helix-turn-helix transcriptional regulator n=1 Tax=Cupriavidus nantongensis TaxID=1796606 RepID=UPI00358E05BB
MIKDVEVVPYRDAGASGHGTAATTARPTARPATAPGSAPALVANNGIKVFGERHLVPVRQRVRHGATPGLVTALQAEPTHEGRSAVMQSAIRAIGFDWLGYATAGHVGGQLQPRTFFESYSPPGWRERYFRERYYEIDPRTPQPGTFCLPTVWDADDLAQTPLGNVPPLRRRRFLEDLRDAGVRSGIFLNLPMPGNSEFVLISFMSGIESRRWIGDSVVGQALAMGLALHEFLTCHVEIPAFAGRHREGLSDVQRDILACLAQGLSDKEIARRMDMSIFNVDYHMRRLRSHFGVRNRVQLASAATLLRPPGAPLSVDREKDAAGVIAA